MNSKPIEEWLTESLARNWYYGREIRDRLMAYCQDLEPGMAYDFAQSWIINIIDANIYPSRKLHTPLLDLWGFVVGYSAASIPERELEVPQEMELVESS
jgi:hypothetical protein